MSAGPISGTRVTACSAALSLEPGDVHVWTASLDERVSGIEQLETTLSPRERDRAERFRFDEHRSRYIFSHAVLRDTLDRYVGVGPDQLEFQRNSFGKPFLVENDAPRPPFFNMSHAERLVAIAVTADRPVGVDVEWIRTIEDMDSIVRHWFAPRERASVLEAPLQDKARAFYTCWVRKEAYIKARGMGLSMSLRSFDTATDIGFVRSAGEVVDPSSTAGWQIANVPLPDGFVGAVAIRGTVARPIMLSSPLARTASVA